MEGKAPLSVAFYVWITTQYSPWKISRNEVWWFLLMCNVKWHAEHVDHLLLHSPIVRVMEFHAWFLEESW